MSSDHTTHAERDDAAPAHCAPNILDDWDAAAEAYVRFSGQIGFYRDSAADLCAMVPKETERLLDFGCGHGRLTIALAAKLPRLSEAILVDGAQRMLDRISISSPGVTITPLLDDEKLARCRTEIGGPVDVIASNGAVQNLRDAHMRPAPGDFLAGAAALLPAGGRILANFPDQDFELEGNRRSQFRFQADAIWPRPDAEETTPLWSRGLLEAAGDHAGFDVILHRQEYLVDWNDFITFYRIPFMGQSRFPKDYSARIAMLEATPPAFETLRYHWVIAEFIKR